VAGGELRGVAYQVSEPIARRWVDEDWILPLLDGLDEVAPEHQTACLAAVTAFRDSRATRFPGVVVTSRLTEYDAHQLEPEPRSAVVLQPLRREQIEAAVEHAGDELVGPARGPAGRSRAVGAGPSHR